MIGSAVVLFAGEEVSWLAVVVVALGLLGMLLGAAMRVRRRA